ncbi:MAG: hypothetical protein ACKPCM_17035 [Pseudanabaena sp.]
MAFFSLFPKTVRSIGYSNPKLKDNRPNQGRLRRLCVEQIPIGFDFAQPPTDG